MKCTSAEANKMLRKLFDDHNDLIKKEVDARIFKAATVENLEGARPEYDYTSVQQALAGIETQIR